MDSDSTVAHGIASCCAELIRKHSRCESGLRFRSEFVSGKADGLEGVRRTQQFSKRLLVCLEQGAAGKSKWRKSKITAEERGSVAKTGFGAVLRGSRGLGEGQTRCVGF